jgi:hypothetical protein
MMLPGDMIAAFLKPFVKGTKYEDCDRCKRRKEAINKAFTSAINWAIGLFKK